MVTYSRAAIAVGLVVLLVTAPVGAAATGQSPGVAQSGAQDDDSVEPADEAYVEDDGDVVLVYRSDEGDASMNGRFGADLSEGLFHAFLNDTMEEPPGNNFTGNASLELGPESMTGDGAFSMAKPDSIEDLSFDASATRTRQESAASMTLDGTFVDESNAAAQGTSSLESVSTEGRVTVTGTSFSADGSTTASVSEAQSPAESAMAHEFTLSETGDAYVLSGAQNYTVGPYGADAWSSRENATRTLESQFESVASDLDGEVSVTVDSYSFDDETNRVDIEYTVRFTGVDEAVSEQMATLLSESRDLDLSESEARDLADRIQSVELTELSGSVEARSQEVSARWSVQIDNYDEAVLATFDLAEAADVNATESDLERARSQFEAQQAADLRRTVEWEGSVSSPSADTATVEFDAEYRTENWSDYVDELESRDVEWPGDSSFESHAETRDGELTATVSASFSQEGLVENAIEGMLQEPGTADRQSGSNEQAREFLRSLQRSGFERAKMDVAVGDGAVTVEAGASFDNASAFRDVVSDEYGDLGVASVVGETENGETVTYVRLRDAVGSDADESDVRALSTVDDDTEVHTADDWNESETEFPEMNTEDARNYLGTDDGGDGEDETSDSSLPGFGPVVALIALAGFALVARRRAA
ncbi:PGF-CTERM sorting domain-containing protein [Halostella sp. JP-L12]|uniref:PGF-CTERM sorting domain-containing protein n=1 Tax=Halostella TaxID=1843185 RepID=UPI000EF80FB8|nr:MULTISPECIES: PGF-CTERM sorting domain-containing protein [Halostella]NHN47011.1 PGF-CTERM sorting domain-containing protein [Halostella sp. JP-L12]